MGPGPKSAVDNEERFRLAARHASLGKPPRASYGIHAFDRAAMMKPVAMAAKRAHPARMAFGPGGLS